MKYIYIIICILFISGCSSAADAETTATTTTTAATTIFAGELSCEMLYFEGQLYMRDFTRPPMDGNLVLHPTGTSAYTLVGTTVAEVNTQFPDRELAASHLPVGTGVYQNDRDQALCVLVGEQLLPLCLYEEN